MSFSARVDSDNTQPVIVKSLDSENNVCIVEGRYSGEFSVQLGTTLASVVQYPAPGEQWLVQRVLGGWQLHSRLDFQDPRLLPSYPPGSTIYGSTGETHIVGGSIHLDSAEVSINGTDLEEYVSQRSSFTLAYGEFVPKTATSIDSTPVVVPMVKSAGNLEFQLTEGGSVVIPRTGNWRVNSRAYSIDPNMTHQVHVNDVRKVVTRGSAYQILSLKKDDVLSLRALSSVGNLQIDPRDGGTILTLEYASAS